MTQPLYFNLRQPMQIELENGLNLSKDSLLAISHSPSRISIGVRDEIFQIFHTLFTIMQKPIFWY